MQCLPAAVMAIGTLPVVAQSGDDIPAEHLKFFENHVRPSLVKHCYECHSEESGKSKGGLFLDTREGMREGGSSGPLFDEDDWSKSLFVTAINWEDEDYEMPPKKMLPDEVIGNLEKWIQMGAPDPRRRGAFAKVQSEMDIEAGKKHWSYLTPVRPAEKSVDSIIRKKRKSAELEPVAEADAYSLLRRLSFDLNGLPPTPPQVTAFHQAVNKDRKAAITAKVDELLGSKHYGERWGRHWLDVARYAESAGSMNVPYPYAWRFRDYIIDSFNRDKPFDQLIIEQLAGDLLPAKDDADRQEKLIATGFLAIGAKKQNEKNPRVFEMNLIDEQIDTTTRGFMATTVACARCHDHKFDPIPTTDYYAMAGIFKSTETLFGTVAGNQNHRTTELLELPIPDKGVEAVDESDLHARKVVELREVKALNTKMRRQRTSETNKRQLVSMKQKILRLETELNFLNPDGRSATFGMGARDQQVTNTHVLVGGDVTKVAQEVERGFPQVLQFEGTPALPSDTSGRLELAKWIASKNNPLTARVMVNRIWTHLMGTPIVETMDNFGTTGLKPSNPELLDYLAIRFMEEGWSIKTLVREIVLSDTYQRSTLFDEGNYAIDPENQTYWRANPRQLDAEALRDSMLVVSGKLDRSRPFASPLHKLGNSKATRNGGRIFNLDDYNHRSVYLPIVRDSLLDELALFDYPDPDGTIGQRDQTNVAPQSLHLMNSQLVVTQARSMAKLLEKYFDSRREQVKNAFLLCYGRPATKVEIDRSLVFLNDFEPNTAASTPASAEVESRGRRSKRGTMGSEEMRGRGRRGTQEPAPSKALAALPDEEETLAAFCQAIMMSAEFRIIE